jgi:predicted RNase H-like HicB family nuclease
MRDEHTPRYSMVIRWSDEDEIYVVSLPELYGEDRGATHGSTYEEAAKNGREVIALLLEAARDRGEPLPEPRTFASEPARAAAS